MIFKSSEFLLLLCGLFDRWDSFQFFWSIHKGERLSLFSILLTFLAVIFWNSTIIFTVMSTCVAKWLFSADSSCWPAPEPRSVATVGARGGSLAPLQFLAKQLTLSQPGGQIMPNTILQAPPDFQILRRPCSLSMSSYNCLASSNGSSGSKGDFFFFLSNNWLFRAIIATWNYDKDA